MAMIRLVTQFDDTRIKATVATPTCCCCCCCCCCVASVLTTSTVTAMHAHDLAEANNYPPDRRSQTTAAGFFNVFVPGILGMVLGGITLFLIPIVSLIAFVAIPLMVSRDLKGFYRKQGIANPDRLFGSSVGTFIMMFVLEFFLAGGALFSSIAVEGETVNPLAQYALIIYAVAIPIVVLILVPLLRRKERPVLQEAMAQIGQGPATTASVPTDLPANPDNPNQPPADPPT